MPRTQGLEFGRADFALFQIAVRLFNQFDGITSNFIAFHLKSEFRAGPLINRIGTEPVFLAVLVLAGGVAKLISPNWNLYGRDFA